MFYFNSLVCTPVKPFVIHLPVLTFSGFLCKHMTCDWSVVTGTFIFAFFITCYKNSNQIKIH